MRKVKLIASSLCIAAVLAMAMPTAVYADDGTGPQGGVKSTKDAPPPPTTPPSSGGGGVLGTLIAYLLG